MRFAKQRPARNPSARLYLELLEDRALLSTSIPLNPKSWTPLGPSHIIRCQTEGRGACAGRITALAPHPQDADTVYAGSAGGGVWKTTNGGKSWTALTDDQATLFVGAVALAPSNPDVIYAGTGEANYGPSKTRLRRENIYYGFGVLKSSDAGARWELLGKDVFHRRTISRVVVDPKDENTLYVAVGARAFNGLAGNTGVWKSTDGGQTWERRIAGINLTDDDAVSDLVMDPTNPSVLYAAVGTPTGGDANGVYKTADGGKTWTVAGDFPLGTKDPFMGRISLAIAPSAPQVVHAAIAGSGQMGATLGLLRHARTADGGAAWANLTGVPSYMSTAGDYMNVLTIDPADPDIVYAAGLDPFASRNGGKNWFPLFRGVDSHGPHVDFHALAFDAAGRLVVGNDGGVWRLENPLPGEILWSNLNSDLLTFQFVGVALDPTNPDRAFGGAQDNGTVRFQDDLVWQHIRSGDGGHVRVDHANPQTLYHTFQYTVGGGFFERSDDGGQNWMGRTSGINFTEPAKFYPPYVIDPSNPSRLLLGTNRVYETTNRGGQWTPRSQPGTGGWTVSAILDAVAPAPSDRDTIYASAGGRIFVTTDRGVSWQETNPVPAMPGLRLTDIEVDPNHPWVAYAVSGSFGDLSNGQRVWATYDYGGTWYDMTGDLPDLPAWSLAVAWGTEGVGDEIFAVGTDGGVFFSYDYGQTWPRLAEGLPRVQVHELELNLDLGILSAATHGRGLWQLEVTPQDRPTPAARRGSADVVAALALASPSVFATQFSVVEFLTPASRPEGPEQTSPGQRPGNDDHVIRQRPERAQQIEVEFRLVVPFQGEEMEIGLSSQGVALG